MFSIVTTLAAVVMAATAVAAAPGGGTPDAVTQHVIALGGKSYAYTARAGTITLQNDKDQPTAQIFYTAFTLDGADPRTRPVTFFYNGGPGSSTIWLRMGSFAPMRVQVGDGVPTPGAPFTLAENQYSLLDRTDLVFIDAPGTGFGRIVGAGTPKEFYGVDPDVRGLRPVHLPLHFDVWALELTEVSLRRILWDAALGDARQLPAAAARHRRQRRRAALVGSRF